MVRVVLGFSLALIAGFGLFLPFQAAGQGDFYPLQIYAFTCESEPELDLIFVTAPECQPDPGVTFTVTDADTGTVLGSCVTESDGPTRAFCHVNIDFGQTAVITEDTSTVRPGYFPVENPISISAPAESFPTAVGLVPFINLLQAAPPIPSPVDIADPEVPGTGASSLPNTGSGSVLDKPGIEWAPLIFATAAMLVAAVVCGARPLRRFALPPRRKANEQ